MKKLDLPSITAICVDGRPMTSEMIDRYSKIVGYMRSRINFGCIKLLMIEDPGIDGTEFVKIDAMPTLQDYSDFCISEMHKHVETDHCLIFQEDGYALNPEMWRPIFLEYDYIGAPWPPLLPWPAPDRLDRRVGNGGFSLRSKRLLERIKDFKTDINEDIAIVTVYRDELDREGFKFAPIMLATDFSMETRFIESQAIESSFGFHGKFHVETAAKIIEERLALNP